MCGCYERFFKKRFFVHFKVPAANIIVASFQAHTLRCTKYKTKTHCGAGASINLNNGDVSVGTRAHTHEPLWTTALVDTLSIQPKCEQQQTAEEFTTKPLPSRKRRVSMNLPAKVTHNGHIYTSKGSAGSRMFYRCALYKKIGCKASLSVNKNNGGDLREGRAPHEHGVEEDTAENDSFGLFSELLMSFDDSVAE